MDSLLVAVSWFDPSWWWSIAQVIIGLGLVIFVHELGHFLVAKACGVKCEKFYVGFDFFDLKLGDRVIIPRSLVKWTWGETEYGVGIIPLGGYVKMLGQDDNPGNIEEDNRRSNPDAESNQDDDQAFYDRNKLDPRSFKAKSVPQRMAIISAGVVFNLIFAVVFAAIAFRVGVNYEPPVVGLTLPGGPAWKANLDGADIKRIGDKKVDGYFTFVNLAEEIAFAERDKELEFEILPPGASTTTTVWITPERGLIKQAPDLAVIGVDRAVLPRLPEVKGDDSPTIKGNPAHDATPPFKGGDLIVALDGHAISSDYELRSYLTKNADREVTFSVERENGDSAPEVLEIKVGKNHRRNLGFTFKWEPIDAIQSNSPAAEAELKEGDEILKIDGVDRGNLFTLNERMAAIAREGSRSVPFLINRDGAEMTVQVTPRDSGVPILRPGEPIGIASLGLAIRATNEVESSTVEGISVGDKIAHFKLVEEDKDSPAPWRKYLFPGLIAFLMISMAATSSKDSGLMSLLILLAVGAICYPFFKDYFKTETKISDPVTIYSTLQFQPHGQEFSVDIPTSESSDETNTIELTTTKSDSSFLSSRGMMLTAYKRNYQSQSLADALKYGGLQTMNDGGRVWKFLTKLVKGEISATNLGGPGTIAMVATNEASQGTSRLLLFLTLLSANLAIVNFLPIPILDGGHMLFLAYEGLFRRPVSERAQIVLSYAGLFFIIGLMLFVIFLDASRFASL